MPNKFLFNCDGATPESLGITDKGYDSIDNINIYIDKRNVRFDIDSFAHEILKKEITTLPWDLLDIALYVYTADNSSPRGGSLVDEHALKWKREFTLLIPVRNPDVWNKPETISLLQDMLGFLTDDKYEFHFCEIQKESARQLSLELPDDPKPLSDANCVALFSGGLDSLSGVVNDVLNHSKKPILVSHRTSNKLYTRQNRLAEHLRTNITSWGFPHIRALANRIGTRAREDTQRSRSFLYLSLAATVAYENNIDEIMVYENGVTSFNLPKTAASISTMASRTTNPKFIRQFELLARQLFCRNISVTTPYIFMTKAEVIKKIKDNNLGDLIGASFSCTHTIASTSHQPHCGTCSQCVDRKFSVIASNTEANDYPEGTGYEKNIFIENLDVGKERFYSENYVRAAMKIDRMAPGDFIQEYPEIYDCLLAMEDIDNKFIADDALGQVYEMSQRHATEVLRVIGEMTTRNIDTFIKDKLPPNCLISIVRDRNHLKDPIETLARRLGTVLDKGIRRIFQKKIPKDEKEIQDAMQGILVSNETKLQREFPILKYGIVGTKPDFATDNFDLFVEAKHLPDKTRKSDLTSSTTSRVTVYRDQGAHVLFYVFVNSGVQVDENDIIATLEKHEGVYVTVTRG